MRSEIAYGSLLVYSPRGTSEVCKQSRDICYKVKAGDSATLQLVARRIREHVDRRDMLAELFAADLTLVPMPRSAPLVSGALWPSDKIAQSLLGVGLGSHVVPILERTTAVAKSSHAAPGERPAVQQHFDSFRAHARVEASDRILVIDDVITKGATALAAVSRLAETYPRARIEVLAIIRTMGLVAEIERILNPTTGRVLDIGGEARREP